jgi:phenol hydroxylase P4 protein
MGVAAIGEYVFEPTDGAAAYGDDQLVMVHREDPGLWFCAAACFRAPKAMRWADFKAQMIDGWCATDPDYDPASATAWRIFDEPFEPSDDATLAELGIAHKSLVKFATP